MSGKNKLWVDDIRTPPDETWIWVKKVEEAIKAIHMFLPTVISLDHDIEDRPADETFKPIAYYISALGYYKKLPEDKLRITIHSSNSVGAEQMYKTLKDSGINSEIIPYQSMQQEEKVEEVKVEEVVEPKLVEEIDPNRVNFDWGVWPDQKEKI